MCPLKPEDVYRFIDGNIDSFHASKLDAMKKLRLSKLLKRKNPYLFKAKNVTTAEEFVRKLLAAHLSSQEETMFGNFLEEIAIFVNEQAFGGEKSPAQGIDLDFTRGGTRYLVSIKSGPNWGNSGQIQNMKNNFKQAKKIVGQNVICVNGCCYGKNRNENKGDYIKKCGQSFWEFITGIREFYKEIIEPLGVRSKERNEEFMKEYGKVINRFSKEFINNFCKNNGAIDWERILEFNSGRDKVKYRKLTDF